MYLAYPAPDDEELALSLETLKVKFRESMEREPARFTLRGRHKARRKPKVRKGSGDPLRLTRALQKPKGKGKATAIAPRSEDHTAPERLLREALAAARRRGYSLEELAERAGMSERTLRRRLKSPGEIPLGEYCVIMRAASVRAVESEG